MHLIERREALCRLTTLRGNVLLAALRRLQPALQVVFKGTKDGGLLLELRKPVGTFEEGRIRFLAATLDEERFGSEVAEQEGVLVEGLDIGEDSGVVVGLEELDENGGVRGTEAGMVIAGNVSVFTRMAWRAHMAEKSCCVISSSRERARGARGANMPCQ